MGVHGHNAELIKIIGRMKYHPPMVKICYNILESSQALWRYGLRVGFDPKLAKRAGLLHDIGKVLEDETETPHTILGMEWAEKNMVRKRGLQCNWCPRQINDFTIISNSSGM